jgi:uncharacterized protein (DUF1697 family)
MSTFVVLLRGVNVGGNNKLPMADLRAALEADGLTDVRTYIQSGNVILTSTSRSADVVGARVRAVIARDFGLDIPAIALRDTDLRAIAQANPHADEPNPRRLHAIVLPHAPDAATLTAVRAKEEAAAAKGGRDTVTIVDRTAYLHTPDGFGSSELAKALSAGRSNPLAGGTARNWATITTLLGMCAS